MTRPDPVEQHRAPIDTVVLDLDGTLVDSVYVHTQAWRAAFCAVGIDLPAHRIHRAIGMGGDRLVGHLAGDAAERAVGDDVRRIQGEQMEARFGEIRATEGAGELLEALHDRGLKVVLASSGAKDLTERLLDLVPGSARLLQERVAGADADRSKPAGDLVGLALRAVDAEHALLVGDATWDARSAADAGVGCLGVLTGGISEAELLEAGMLAVYDSPGDLARQLDAALTL